ncbi:hypothetical protein SAMN04515674_101445 [Pseudarcicella hirudinis]|uniref:Uncharacterized protein n=1 Tax=Pseudarcicella hirudinis TaxID=1079859 RepID=A0A1I5MTS7_9BACT|nr:hypothetical protein [Pseudarcicella hirudinis]SFP12958.1 hypothetical protein SAMN04515674_101445 [Pseudarcicella hirudinis]
MNSIEQENINDQIEEFYKKTGIAIWYLVEPAEIYHGMLVASMDFGVSESDFWCKDCQFKYFHIDSRKWEFYLCTNSGRILLFIRHTSATSLFYPLTLDLGNQFKQGVNAKIPVISDLIDRYQLFDRSLVNGYSINPNILLGICSDGAGNFTQRNF